MIRAWVEEPGKVAANGVERIRLVSDGKSSRLLCAFLITPTVIPNKLDTRDDDLDKKIDRLMRGAK